METFMVKNMFCALFGSMVIVMPMPASSSPPTREAPQKLVQALMVVTPCVLSTVSVIYACREIRSADRRLAELTAHRDQIRAGRALYVPEACTDDVFKDRMQQFLTNYTDDHLARAWAYYCMKKMRRQSLAQASIQVQPSATKEAKIAYAEYILDKHQQACAQSYRQHDSEAIVYFSQNFEALERECRGALQEYQHEIGGLCMLAGRLFIDRLLNR
jgi:hypothetical protein